MEKQIIKIPITGSDGDPYTITLRLDTDGLLKIKCNCRAGIFGPYCKHRIAILSGDLSAAVEPVTQWPLIASWVEAAGLYELMQEFHFRQRELDALNKKLKVLKAQLGDKMKTGISLYPPA